MDSKSGTTRSIIIIGALFFIFGFITWLNSVLIPYLRIACELNNLEYISGSVFILHIIIYNGNTISMGIKENRF
jgi:fucose permease